MKNYGVTIYLNDDDQTDLKEILSVIGEKGKLSNWQISEVECFGDCAETLHTVSDNKTRITGGEFYRIVSKINQVIDGTFEAFELNETERWLTIRSIRGGEFDVETEDKEVLKKIYNSFSKVQNLVY